MKVSFRKTRHLYYIYAILNAVLISVILISITYLNNKQSWLSEFAQSAGNELIKLNDYKSASFNFSSGKDLDNDFYKNGSNQKTDEFIDKINNSKKLITQLNSDYSISDVHFKENITALISDYEIIISQNTLLLDYLYKIGNSDNGMQSSFSNAYRDFEQKLKQYPNNQTINADLNQSVYLINLLVRTKDQQLLMDVEKKMNHIKDAVSVPDTTSSDYVMLRLFDSYQNLELTYTQLAKTILEIGTDKSNGLLGIMNDRYQKANYRMGNSIEIIQHEIKKARIYSFIVILILFSFVVAFNFGSALYFVRYSRNFSKSFVEHLNALQKGEFFSIDKNNIPFEAYELVDKIEDYSRKFVSTGKNIVAISAGNFKPLTKKNDYLEWLFPALNQIKQKFENLNEQLKGEKAKQSELQWIKAGTDRLTEVMRQEFDNPLLHSNRIIFALIQYLDIPMGAIYHIKDEGGNKYIEMAASFAYGKEKQLYKKIVMGEGMIGSVATEKKTLNLTNIPEGYFNILSGFSETKPKNIIVCPIKLNEEIYGVIELASLSKFSDVEILFVEEVCKAIAYSFAISKVYTDTLNLFENANLEIAQFKEENESLLTDNEELRSNYKNIKEISADNDYLVEKLNEFAIMLYLDLDGNILEVNSRFEQFFKSDKKKFLHSNYREYMIEMGDEYDFESVWRDLRAGIQHEINQKVVVANEEFWLNQHYLPMKDQKGRVKGIKIMAFEITDKHKIEPQHS